MCRAPNRQMSFADLEFMRQGIVLEPAIKAVCEFLDAHADLVERVREDLERGLKRPATGRRGMSAEQVLRSLVLQRIKNWDYRELRERIADGYSLRWFTGFYSQSVPEHDAFNRAFNRLTPCTLEVINAEVIEAAVRLGLEDGSKLRADTTVVETDIHHPTDNTLLWDVVRVLTRLVRQLDKRLEGRIEGFPNRTRSARRRMQKIQRMTLRQRREQQGPTYRELIGITDEVVSNARQVLERTAWIRARDLRGEIAAKHLRAEIDRYCGLGERVIDQARRRVLEGESVPNEQKIFSIFEPHTDLIKRGKVLKPVEFGHKVFLAESACGLITQYRVLDGNPADIDHVEPALQQHAQTFARPPELYAMDRGFYSEDNLTMCQHAGVSLACIPQSGGTRTAEREAHEKSPAFKQGQRFRAGIEGRISVLFRGRGMKRCLAHGRERFELLVGAAVLANNLMMIATLLTNKNKRHTRRRAA